MVDPAMPRRVNAWSWSLGERLTAPYGPSPRIDHPDSRARHPCRLIPGSAPRSPTSVPPSHPQIERSPHQSRDSSSFGAEAERSREPGVSLNSPSQTPQLAQESLLRPKPENRTDRRPDSRRPHVSGPATRSHSELPVSVGAFANATDHLRKRNCIRGGSASAR